MLDCIFCKIIKDQIPCKKVYEDEDLLAFHDIHPISLVHFMIIPKIHIDSLERCTEVHQALLGKMLLLAPQLAREQGLENDPGVRSAFLDTRDCGQNTLVDALCCGGLAVERVIDAQEQHHRIGLEVRSVEPAFAALSLRLQPVQNMFDPVARNAEIQSLHRGDRAAEGLVPDGPSAELTRKPRVRIEMPEIGDRIADKDKPDRCERLRSGKLIFDLDRALLPVVLTSSRRLRDEAMLILRECRLGCRPKDCQRDTAHILLKSTPHSSIPSPMRPKVVRNRR